jgi:hypothetical protein
VYLRRLTNAEYRQTVRDLLGDGPDRAANLPTDAVHDGFDNNAEAIAISNVHIEKYREAAEQIAADVIADAARRDRVVACSLAANKTGCLAQFIASFGRKAYRRPLAPEEEAGVEDDELGPACRRDSGAAVDGTHGGRELPAARLEVPHEAEERRMHGKSHVVLARELAEALGERVVHPESALEVDLAGRVLPPEEELDGLLRRLAGR